MPGAEQLQLRGEVLGAEQHRVYCRRHAMLFAYFLPVFTCGFYQNAIAPIADVFGHFLDASILDVAMFANIIMILNVPISFVAPPLFERKGMRFSCWVGTLLLFVGGWIRYIAVIAVNSNRKDIIFWLLFSGQCIMSTGFPILLAGAATLSNAWYSSEGRAIATAVASLAPIIGSVTASIVAPSFFPANGTSRQRQTQMQQYFLFQAFLGVAAVMFMLILRNEPPTPPCPKNDLNLSSPRLTHQGVSKSVVKALRCRPFRALMVVFGCGYASFNSITTLINAILRPDGFSDNEIGNIGAGLGAGIIGSFVFGALADKTKKFSLLSKWCVAFALPSFLAFVVTSYIPGLNWLWTFAALGFAGFFAIPIIPLLFELGVEVLFPMSESVVGSLLWCSANTLALLTVVVSASIDLGHGKFRMLPALGLYFALLVIAGLFMFPFHGEMNRQMFEEAQCSNSFP